MTRPVTRVRRPALVQAHGLRLVLAVCTLFPCPVPAQQRPEVPADRAGSTATSGWPHLRGPSYAGVSAEAGLPAAWPLAAWLARRFATRRPLLHDALAALLTFSVFFWAAGAFTVWKTHLAP
ncbi:MAG: hypothetical protein HYZ53_13270 [Planctomycetes bacterium]|nr:hypothetical protein [Planctomycetota bacterium]